jgi:hypothetical protein
MVGLGEGGVAIPPLSYAVAQISRTLLHRSAGWRQMKPTLVAAQPGAVRNFELLLS